jgi:carbon-monoxide dehydrogenase small subunit
MTHTISFTLNGRKEIRSIESHVTLLDLLRNDLGMTGTKRGCEQGDCGTCIVLVDETPVNACLFLAVRVHGKAVQTVEGMETEQGLHPLQKAFLDKGAVQCGFCTPGMLMTSKSLLERHPDPTETQIRTAISGNICRCTGYQHIVDAIQAAAKNRSPH